MCPWARCVRENHIMGGNGWRLILCLLIGIALAHHPHGPEWVSEISFKYTTHTAQSKEYKVGWFKWSIFSYF